MKHEYKKHEKELYIPKDYPQILTIPKHKFLCIKGKGNPNSEDFTERIGVLYAISYAIKMIPKSGFLPEGYFEYTVYPLEGIWDLSINGIEIQKETGKLVKDELEYTIMIRQPDFVTKDVVEIAFDIIRKKKPNSLLEEVYFDEIEDGLCIQIMHIGPYDDEPESFNKMKEYIKAMGYNRKSMLHREIYLSDARKSEPSKMKTVLRYFIEN